MDKEKLRRLFVDNSLTHSAFVKWAKERGVNIRPGDVSRHVTKGGISRWAELAYLAFVEDARSGKFVFTEEFSESLVEAMKKHRDNEVAEINKQLERIREVLKKHY